MNIIINENVDKLLRSPVKEDNAIGMTLIKDQFRDAFVMMSYFHSTRDKYHVWVNVHIYAFWYDKPDIYL